MWIDQHYPIDEPVEAEFLWLLDYQPHYVRKLKQLIDEPDYWSYGFSINSIKIWQFTMSMEKLREGKRALHNMKWEQNQTHQRTQEDLQRKGMSPQRTM